MISGETLRNRNVIFGGGCAILEETGGGADEKNLIVFAGNNGTISGDGLPKTGSGAIFMEYRG